jgi:hypothetical protein
LYVIEICEEAIELYEAQVAPPKLEYKITLFANFLTEIYLSGMSTQSKKSPKGFLIKECADTLLIKSSALVADEVLLKDVMRNAFTLCLQRDRNAHSLFSTTASGLKAVSFNTTRYRLLAKMVLITDNEEISDYLPVGARNLIRYDDLKKFIGKNNETYSDAKTPSSICYSIDTELTTFSNNMNSTDALAG